MKLTITFLLLILSCSVFQAQNQLKVAQIFSDHAVLQRDLPIVFWGWGNPGAKVEVNFDQQIKTGTITNNGKWSIKFPSKAYDGKKLDLVISSGNESLKFRDLMMGDVWLLSGQSNMEWVVENTNNAPMEMKTATDTLIRHFKVPLSFSKRPEDSLAGGEWQVTHPETVGSFSAVGYYFARTLRKDISVPIGLINSTWGGSRIEPWMSATALRDMGENFDLDAIVMQEEQQFEELKLSAQEKFLDLEVVKELNTEYDTLVPQKIIDQENWVNFDVPSLWENNGYENVDGIGWFKINFILSEEEAQQAVHLSLGPIDDSDMTWVNNVFVGQTIGKYEQARAYTVPSTALKSGLNTLLVKVYDTGGGGGIYGDGDALFIETAERKIMLEGSWQFYLEAVMNSGIRQPNQLPTLLYNKMIYPLLPFAIKGTLWYQGESNANDAAQSFVYRKQFVKLIQQWRTDWKIGDFPFIWVQLANFMDIQENPVDSNWALLRESQTAALKEPKTAQTVIIDLGEADNIHPRNKQDVGLRLSKAALKIAYDKDVIYSGPTFESAMRTEKGILVRFKVKGTGLLVKNGGNAVNNFAVAGENKEFKWVSAQQVDERSVLLKTENASSINYIRFAWADNPKDFNLYNKEGLPATPFQIDLNKNK